MRRVAIAAVLALVAVVGAVAGGAGATTAAESAYASKVEPICRAGTPAIESLLQGTRGMAKHGQPVEAGRRFVKASNVFAGTVRRVSRVKPPAADAQRIHKWVERLANVKEAMRRVGLALKRRNKLKALNRSGQLQDAGISANRAVTGFPFDWCRIRNSRFE